MIMKWQLDRFVEDEVKLSYSNVLKAEVESQEKAREGYKGYRAGWGVLEEWECIVNRVAKAKVGKKVIVCGRSVRWWDNEVKEKIQERREVYRRIVRGEEDLWEE